MSKIRILLADDHMLMRMGISTLVSTAKDMTVVGEARNGREAVELAGSLRPDVVIMDLMMPEMSGGEATKAIHEAHPGIKIVILTTYGTSAELATAVTNGAVGVLLKDARHLYPIGLSASGEELLLMDADSSCVISVYLNNALGAEVVLPLEQIVKLIEEKPEQLRGFMFLADMYYNGTDLLCNPYGSSMIRCPCHFPVVCFSA